MRYESPLGLNRVSSRRAFLRSAINGGGIVLVGLSSGAVFARGTGDGALGYAGIGSGGGSESSSGAGALTGKTGGIDVRNVTAMEFDVSYATEVSTLPSDCELLRVWMPLPPPSTSQGIEGLQISCPVPYEIRTDSVYGNEFAFVETTPDAVPFVLKAKYRITRAQGRIEPATLSEAQRTKYMELTPRVKVSEDIRAFAANVAGNETSAMVVGRRIYDAINEMLSYDNSIPGCGTGDTEWIFKHKNGKCDDYHSLFMAMMISRGIPVRWEQGFPLPYPSSDNVIAGSLEGDCSGAHCWASFYDEDVGWVPVDVSEADKHPELAEFFFGKLTPNRFKISEGREIVFDPPQGGDPLNSLAFAYAEADGLPLIYLVNFRNTIEFEVDEIRMA